METNDRNVAHALRSTLRYRFLLPLAVLLVQACGGGNGNGSASSGLVAHAGCGYADFNQPLSGTLSGSDSQGGALSFSIVDRPTKGSVTLTNPLTGEFTYTPQFNARGTDSFSFRVHSGQSVSNPATYRLVYTPRVVPLGDSITEGIGSSDSPPAAERVSYRKTLYEDLAASGYRVDFVGSLANGTGAGIADPDHEGHAGWCDDNSPSCNVSGGATIDGQITNILNDLVPDAILLHIGTNHFSTDGAGIDSILNKISAWAQANHPVNVYVARIIPTIDGSLDVNTFNNNIQAVAGNRTAINIRVVDQQSQLRGADANRADAAYMADNLHPNPAGYRRMAVRWREDIVASGWLPRCP